MVASGVHHLIFDYHSLRRCVEDESIKWWENGSRSAPGSSDSTGRLPYNCWRCWTPKIILAKRWIPCPERGNNIASDEVILLGKGFFHYILCRTLGWFCSKWSSMEGSSSGMCARVCVRAHVYMYLYMYLSMCVYVCVCVCVCGFIY